MKRKIILLASALILSAMIFACQDEYAEKMSKIEGLAAPQPSGSISQMDVAVKESRDQIASNVQSSPPPQAGAMGGAFEVSDRKIIRNANFSLEIKNYDSWWNNVQKLVSANNGFIVNSTTENVDNNVRKGNVVVRVPELRFSSMLESIRKGAAKVERETQSGEDVTEEFFDLEARLINKKKAEQRMQEILQKATKIRDLLEVENSLTQIREEIEQMEGRKKYLQDRVSYSTITIDWHEPFPLGASNGGEKTFWDKISDGFKTGLEGFGAVLGGLIAFIIGGFPFFIFIALIVWLFFRLAKRRKAKITNSQNEERTGKE